MDIREYDFVRVKTAETTAIIEHINMFMSLVQELESSSCWFQRGDNKPMLLIGVDDVTGQANVDLYSEIDLTTFMKKTDMVVKELHTEHELLKSLCTDLENKMNQLLNNSVTGS